MSEVDHVGGWPYTHIYTYTQYIYNIHTYIYMLYMLYKSHEIQWSRATTSASRRNAAMAWLPQSSPRTPSADAGRGWRAAATSSAMTLGPGCWKYGDFMGESWGYSWIQLCVYIYITYYIHIRIRIIYIYIRIIYKISLGIISSLLLHYWWLYLSQSTSYLEDHPTDRNWITPLNGDLPTKFINHLLSGMILQVGYSWEYRVKHLPQAMV